MKLTTTHKKALMLLGCGGLYALWVHLTHLYIPCVFRLMTGLKCPGCGVTHMCMAILKGQFSLAYQANPFLFITWPYILFELLLEKRLRQNVYANRWNQLSIGLYLAGLLAFGVWRNL